MPILYVCVSIPALEISSSVPFFKIPHTCINMQSLFFFFWLTSPCKAKQSPGPSTSLQMTHFHSLLWPSRTLYFRAPKSLQMGIAAMKLRRLLFGRKVMTNLDSILKSRDITLPTKVHLVKAMVFQWSCMDVRVGLWRKLSTKEWMLLNCGVGKDSGESLGLQGNPTSPF